MNNLPFIFFAFANSEERYLPNLRKESQGILDYFLSAKFQRQLLDFYHKEHVSSEDFFKLFTKNGKKINILHYSGHANSLGINLKDTTYFIEQLSLLLSGSNNLELVFLNGCSTKEMVDTLLEKGVKAVIATSEEIADNQACDFSIAFYEAFVEQGRTLEQAFKMAASDLKNKPLKEEDLFISRSLKDTKYKNKSIPWALYYRDEEESQLQWKLIESSPNLLDKDPAFLLKLEGIKKEIAALRKKELELKEAVKQWLAVPKEVRTTTPIIQDSLQKSEEDLSKTEADIHQLYLNISEFIIQYDKVDLEERLDDALYKINFRKQLQSFEDHLSNQNLMAFILQGSAACGQDLLKERLIDLAGLRYEGEFHVEIKIPFRANTVVVSKTHPIWSIIKQELEDIESEVPQVIVEELYEKYFKERKDIVFIFDNVHNIPLNQAFSYIQELWSLVWEVFEAKIKTSPSSNKVLLIIIDRNCFPDENEKSISHKKTKYEQHINKAFAIKEKVALLPIVQPLYFQDLRDWKTNQQLPNDLVSKDMLEKIAEEEEKSILPTIKRICLQTNMKTLFETKYRKYFVIKP